MQPVTTRETGWEVMSFDSVEGIDVNSRVGEALSAAVRERSQVLTDEEVAILNVELEGQPGMVVLIREGDVIWLASRKRLHDSEDLSELARVYSVIARGKDATVFTDVTGALIAASKSWRSIYGYTLGELIGQNPRVINSRQHPKSKFKEMWQALTNREIGTWSAELLNRRRNGELVRVWQTITTVRAGNGLIQGYLGQTRDMTGYESVRDQLERQNQKLSELSDFKGEMMEIMAHDLKSPLQAVLGYRELAGMSLESGNVAELSNYLEGIQRTGESMLRLIQNFLDLQRSQAGRLQIKPQRMNLRRLLRSVVEWQSISGQVRGVEVCFHEEGQVYPSFLDMVRIEQAIGNIISNAVKFTRRHSKVMVRVVREPGRSERIEVDDEGPGVPEEALDKIFDAYYQVNHGGASQGSVGWGLAIAHSIVDGHGGEIIARNREEGGCRFTIKLPSGYQWFYQSLHSVVFYDPLEMWYHRFFEYFQEQTIPSFIASDTDSFRHICLQELPALIMCGEQTWPPIPELNAPDSVQQLQPLQIQFLRESRDPDDCFKVVAGHAELRSLWARIEPDLAARCIKSVC